MSDLPTKRDWLVARGLAKAGVVGRFSNEAKEALAKAEAEGVKFADNVPTQRTPVITQAYDAKKVRVWAARNGVDVGLRGRIPAPVVERYLSEVGADSDAGSGGITVTQPVSSVPAPAEVKEKVRTETVAWGVARRRDGDGEHISEPVVALSSCGRCGEGVSYCRCTSGPYTPKWMGGEQASLTKPTS